MTKLSQAQVESVLTKSTTSKVKYELVETKVEPYSNTFMARVKLSAIAPFKIETGLDNMLDRIHRAIYPFSRHVVIDKMMTDPNMEYITLRFFEDQGYDNLSAKTMEDVLGLITRAIE